MEEEQGVGRKKKGAGPARTGITRAQGKPSEIWIGEQVKRIPEASKAGKAEGSKDNKQSRWSQQHLIQPGREYKASDQSRAVRCEKAGTCN